MCTIGDEDQETGQEIANNFFKGDQVGVLDYMSDMYNKEMKTIFVATFLDVLNENFTNWSVAQ